MAKQIQELLHAKPFRPFRICLSDGFHYDILNHDAAFVSKDVVEVCLDTEYVARCSILHITKIEDLPEHSAHA